MHRLLGDRQVRRPGSHPPIPGTREVPEPTLPHTHREQKGGTTAVSYERRLQGLQRKAPVTDAET